VREAFIKVKALFIPGQDTFLEWLAALAIHQIPNRALQIVGKFSFAFG
jgi:hypothetical protein